MKSEDKKLLLVLAIFLVCVSSITILITLSGKKTVIPKQYNASNNNNSLNSQTDILTAFPVDLNTVTKEQLMEIDGIGDKTATAIIDYRINNGGYKNIEQLLNVEGIGEKTFEKLKKYLYVSAPSVTTSSQDTTKKTDTTQKVSDPASPVDINFATIEELMMLKGIGDVKANAIIEYRKTKGYFYSVEEIMNVNGIGINIFNEIRGSIKVDTSRLPSQNKPVTTTTTTTETTQTQEISEQPPLAENEKVNVNIATREELLMVPGITESSVDKIIDHRSHAGCEFVTLREVETVIGLKQYNQIKGYIIC